MRTVISALLSGVFVLLILTSCSDSENLPVTQNPEDMGCLSYADYSQNSEPPLAGETPWFDKATAVAVQGNKAYVAGAQLGMQIFDTSDPSQPVLLSSMPMPGIARAHDIAIYQNFIFILDYLSPESTLHVAEMNNSRPPKIIKSLTFAGAYTDIDLVYPYLFVNRNSQGIAVFDILKPRETELVGEIDFGDYIVDLAVEDGYAFCLSFEALQIFDVRNPANLRLVSRLDSNTYSVGIDVSGDLAVLSGDSTSIIDVSSVSQPRHIATIDVSGDDVALIDNRAFVVSHRHEVLTGINLSNPEAPFVCSSLDLPLALIADIDKKTSLTLAGDLAYIAASSYGMLIVDVSAPQQSELLSHFTCMGPAPDVAYLNGYAYVTSYQNPLMIFEMTSGNTWESAGYLELESSAISIEADGDRLYASGRDSLLVFDASDPLAPALAGTYEPGSSIRDWDVLDNIACLALGNNDISFVDFSSAAVPVAMETVYLGTQPNSVVLHDGHAFVATSSGGLKVVRYDPPDEIAIVGSLDFDERATSLTVDGSTLYVVAGDFYVVDVSIPTAPFVLGTSSAPFAIKADLLADDGLVYFKNRTAVSVFDVKNQWHPILLTTTDHGGLGRDGLGLALGPEVVLIARGQKTYYTRSGLCYMWRDCGDNTIKSSDKSLLSGCGL